MIKINIFSILLVVNVPFYFHLFTGSSMIMMTTTVNAWQIIITTKTTPLKNNHHHYRYNGNNNNSNNNRLDVTSSSSSLSSSRRDFVISTTNTFTKSFVATAAVTTTIAITTAMTTTTVFPQNAIAAATTSSSTLSLNAAKTQWADALIVLDDLVTNWSTIASATGGGDAIRTKLGTQGTISPLFQIDKVLKVLRDSDAVDDFIEFQETADEFQLTLSRADSMAYSANFAGGSGKPTPPAVYIEKSKVEVLELQKIAKQLNAMLSLK